ncbi:TatD family hydrolase [Butyrivibrio sp. INlla14]|uniref:TatD family hydrolase n=1 Tax=Butyrivibrio sp. INlla14 TaxID=1520808 RepID=UPI0008769DE4|nr:TatD family hydrolase [Butyrivibrio sp. INlla14]SCX92422.1 TatD DNase family protein [Butyrivibrio sp. INlla14]
MIFDTHAHYDDEQFDTDREELIGSLKDAGIGYVANIGASLSSSQASMDLAHKYDFFYAVVGVHPSEVEELDEDNIKKLMEWSRDDKCVAIGEIGLDYHWPDPAPELQKIWFRRQLQIAREVKLPVVIHSREAAQDTIDIMKDEHAEDIGGVVHCFSYSKEIADICLKMGFYIGIGGVLTFKNAKKMVEVVENTPMDRIILETDCPYLAPEPFRGKRNCSLYLPYVVDKMAEIKKITREEVIKITEDNARRMYGLDR